MRYLSLFLFAISLAFSAQAQNKTLFFSDDFTDNRNNWKESRSKIGIRDMYSGTYFLKHFRNEKSFSALKNFDIKPTEDFEIEALITKVDGTNKHGFGLVWGRKDDANEYNFLINGRGSFKIKQVKNGKSTNLVKWKRKGVIHKKDASNKLIIRKIDKEIYFYINNRQVAKLAFLPLFGSKLGFKIYHNIGFAVEYFKIYKLDSQKRTAQAYPPDLQIKHLKFTEPSGNKALNGGETAYIQFELMNKGRGDAFDISLNINSLNSDKGLDFEHNISLGNIASKASRAVKIPIKASLDIASMERLFRIEILEAFGFDPDPILIDFETQIAQVPDLQVKNIIIDDHTKKNGDSYGNGNSIIEAGESIEVTAFVQNFGDVTAKNVKAQIILKSENPHISYPNQGKIFQLGNIETGGYKAVKFYFYTSRRYAQNNIPLSVQLTETTFSLEKEINLNLKLGVRSENTVNLKISKTDIASVHQMKHIAETMQLADVDKHIPSTQTDGSSILAVIIGLEEYKYTASVEFARHDAATFYRYAKKLFGIPERNIYYRVNEGATMGEFAKIFDENGWLARRIVPNKTRVIVYYAGHGAPNLKTGKAYIIPYDIDPNYASIAVSLDDLYVQLSKLKAKSVSVFIDACFSGLSRSNEMLLDGVRALTIKPSASKLLNDRLLVLSASSDREYSSAYPEKNHGLFTYFLLKALKGDAKQNGKLTAKQLFDYVKKNVSQTANFLDREQSPTLQGNPNILMLKY